jgi:hypothetical protein
MTKNKQRRICTGSNGSLIAPFLQADEFKEGADYNKSPLF